jgi:oligoribonuclease NrnB/cAMP/cGMP phosphodiesterase (DHH superfamily)
MIPLPKPEIILTHESDLDGLLSGVLLQRLARKMFQLEVPLAAYHYNTWKQRELREKSAWVCDFTFESRLDRDNWVVVDHHPVEVAAHRAQLIHDVTKSAGLICYQLCQELGLGSPELDRLVHLNNVADLFLENDPDFVLACDYANLVKSYGFWSIHSLTEGRMEKLLDHPLLEVMAVKRRVEDPLGFAWSKEHVQELNSEIGYVDTVVGNNNVIVHHLLEQKATPYKVLVTLFRKSNGLIIASLRSRNGEAAKAAEKLQGGGHPNAAGAVLPKSVRYISDAVVYMRQIFSPALRRGGPLNNLDALFSSLDLKGK